MAGADAVMVTCSSIGPGVVLAQQLFDIPVIRVDEAMAEAAVRMGRRIGVMATLRTTLEPTIALLREKAAEAGIEIEIVDSLCDGAFDAVLAGDTDDARSHSEPGAEQRDEGRGCGDPGAGLDGEGGEGDAGGHAVRCRC